MIFSWSNFVTFYEVIIAELIFLYSFPRRKLFWLRIVLAVGIVSVIAAFIPEGFGEIVVSKEWELFYRFLRYVLLFVLSSVSMFLCFDASLSSVLSACASGYALQHLANKTTNVINGYANIQEALMNTYGLDWKNSRFILEGIFFPVIYLVGFIVFGRAAAKYGIYKNSSSGTNILSVAMIIVCIGLNRFTGNEGRTYYAIALCIFALLVQIILHHATDLKTENQIILRIMENERKHYNRSKEAIDLINIKLHDLKKKLNSLSDKLLPSEIEEIKKTVGVYNNKIQTGNEVLDVVFAERSSVINENEIKLTVLGDGNALSFMSSMDLYSLFSNAVDNAIEAVLKLEDREKRVISLVIETRGDFININMTNYFNGELNILEGIPLTTKTQEKGHHGFGVKSMKLVAEKYGGSIDIHSSNDKYYLDMFFMNSAS